MMRNSQVSLLNYQGMKEKLMDKRLRVLEVIKTIGPCTAFEVMSYLGVINPNVVRPRITELKQRKLVYVVDHKFINGAWHEVFLTIGC